MNQREVVPLKSILLDIVERYKTYERIRKNCPKLKDQEINRVSEGMIFKFRKYYYIADVHTFNIFRHMNFPNLYEKKKVCMFCKAMYDKIDNNRVNCSNDKNQYLKDKTLIQKEILRILSDSVSSELRISRNERELFSKKFYEKLKNYGYKPINNKVDCPVPKDLLGDYETRM